MTRSPSGSSRAPYDIKRSRLPYLHTNTTFDKLEIHAGQFLVGTAGFTLGTREKPLHISRHGYFKKLEWISSKYFILWDEGDKQGWLTPGSYTLVHLLRASLEHSKTKFKSRFLMDPTSLPDILLTEDGSDAALDLLADEKIRKLRLYVDNFNTGGDDGVRYYHVQDHVEHLYSQLEKLVEHNADAQRRPGLRINPRPRRLLEGFDFRDLATNNDPFFGRVATLGALGKGWVDFARAVNAVTLFGRGFGQLIRPSRVGLGQAARPCGEWSALPLGRFFLAARMADLRNIVEEYGNRDASPVSLAEDVLWCVKDAAFQPCHCETQSLGAGSDAGKFLPRRAHHEPVQVLFPSSFMTRLKKKQAIKALGMYRGAVIFGHNKNIHWRWGDHGDPEEGDPVVEEEEEEVNSNDGSDCKSAREDSGLGSSISSVTGAGDVLGSITGDSVSSASSLPASPRLVKRSDAVAAAVPGGNSGPDTAGQHFEGMKRRLQDRAMPWNKRARKSGDS